MCPASAGSAARATANDSADVLDMELLDMSCKTLGMVGPKFVGALQCCGGHVSEVLCASDASLGFDSCGRDDLIVKGAWKKWPSYKI